MADLAAKIRPLLIDCGSFENALVRGSIETMRLARQDRVFIAVLNSVSDRGVERYLLDPKSPVLAHMLSIWSQSFAQARVRGELRADLGDVEVANWLRAVHLILLLREDLKKKGQEAMVRNFLVPSLKPSPLPVGV
jgi:hypothetical protein